LSRKAHSVAVTTEKRTRIFSGLPYDEVGAAPHDDGVALFGDDGNDFEEMIEGDPGMGIFVIHQRRDEILDPAEAFLLDGLDRLITEVNAFSHRLGNVAIESAPWLRSAGFSCRPQMASSMNRFKHIGRRAG
jgi:hypothetical protein